MSDAEKIADLEKAFARGDYASVTKDAPSLTTSSDDDVQKRAKVLIKRVSPDPVATVLFIVAALLLIAMTVYFEMRAQP